MRDDLRWHGAVERLVAGEWFAAHEALEELWRPAEGAERDTLQGLIHLALVFEHLRRGNARGAWSQWQKANDRLSSPADDWHGLALADWQRGVARFVVSIGLAKRAAGRRHGPLPAPSTWPRPARR